jgi:excisionase family DNA binding protein
MSENLLTTGQVAKRLGVSHGTVKKWIDAGRLNGIRLPGARPGVLGDRRVTQRSLEEFCRKNGFHSPSQERSIACLIIGSRPPMRAEGIDFFHAISMFEGGRLFESLRPDVIVLDFALGTTICCLAAQELLVAYPGVLRVALAYDEERYPMFDRSFSRPFDLAELTSWIKSQKKATQ